MQKIPESLFSAFVRVCMKDWENEQANQKYYEELENYLGKKKFKEELEQVKMVVKLTKVLMGKDER